MVGATVYLATNYLDFSQRREITELNLSGKNLEGELDFTNLGFINLRKIELQDNNLTKLILNNSEQINYLNINNNKISDLRFVGKISDLRFFGDYVENYTRNINYFDFINNPLPEEF